MKIGDSISSYYGFGGLFRQQSGQKNKQDGAFDAGVARSGTGPEPAYAAPSISKAMWDMQPAGDTTIAEETPEEIEAKARHDQLLRDFSEYANMTPAEMIRKRILDQLGLDEDSLKAMSADQREAIEKQIAEATKRELAGVDDEGSGDITHAGGSAPEQASQPSDQPAA